MYDYNLLVTFHHNQKGHAEEEVRDRMKDVGVYIERLEPSDVEGVFLLQVGMDAKEVVRMIKKMCYDAPTELLYTHHWVPIERWVRSDVPDMQRAVKEISEGISISDKWMMHLHKRHIDERYDDLIIKLTDPVVKGDVDLVEPDRIIAVEILGEHAGISLLTREELLDVNKCREEMGLGKV